MSYSYTGVSLVKEVIGENPSRRLELILWTLIYQSDPNPQKYSNWPGNLNGSAETFLTNNKGLIPRLREAVSQQVLVEESHFKWMDNSKRQNAWLNRNIFLQPGHTELPLSAVTPRDLIVARIDLWSTTKNEKKVFLENLEKNWKTVHANKKFDWFKDDNRKCALAWSWLNKHTTLDFHGFAPFEDYEDLMIYFDNDVKMLTTPINEYIPKIKARWAQNKYREKNNEKSQRSFLLSNETISTLEQLSKIHEVSKARILEILIEMEFIRGGHIDEKLARAKLLRKE